MCAICGVFHYRGGRADLDVLARMTDIQAHRGPDDHGVWSDGEIALGNRRLAILDLSSAGHMPMSNEDGSLWVTYNGEIYGWRELRSQLMERGHAFRGHSDTEGLLHLYEDHGEGFLEHLRGMFAFALFDRKERRLILARDRVGIKPLYYHDDGRRIVFASELKALLEDPSVPRVVDAAALADYLTFQYVPCPRTILEGVRKLPPAHCLVADASGVRVRRYWELPREVDRRHGIPYFRDGLRELLQESVRLRLQADVPVGAFLSGGIDSSIVVALMSRVTTAPVKTFSIGFGEQEFDELAHARLVAEHLGTDHSELVVEPRALDVLPALVRQYDEPFADASALPTYYLCQMARRTVTVALSGDGGDEVLGGYVTYPWAEAYRRVDVVPAPLRRLAALPARPLPLDHSLGRRLRRIAMSPIERHLEAGSFFMPEELIEILDPGIRCVLREHNPWESPRRLYDEGRVFGPVGALAYVDQNTYMTDDVLAKVDRASMLNSLEVRVPFVDHKVIEFAAKIPFEYKLRGGVGKWILKEAVKDLLPAATIARPKQGFAIPLSRWLGADFGRLAREILLDDRARRRGFLAPAAVARLLERTDLRADRQSRKVWALVWFELWAQTYLDATVGRESLPAVAESPAAGRA